MSLMTPLMRTDAHMSDHDERDTAVALLQLKALIRRGEDEAATRQGSQAPRRRAPRIAAARGAELGTGGGYLSAQVTDADREPLWDPRSWDGCDPAVQALLDGERERQRPPVKRTAAYYAVIGPAPECAAGEIGKARVYLARIVRALDLGGWSHSEYIGLKRLERQWRERATGRDVRFMQVGNYSGRLLREDEVRIRMMQLAQRRERGR